MKAYPFMIPLLLAGSPAFAEPDFAPAIRADYDASLASLFDYFHRNPELSFKEVKTAARMAKELRAIPGIVVTENVGQTGVVGVMTNGLGPTVLVRADMDGLPVEETNGLSYASKARQVGVDGKVSPVMHACGHDTHITAMIATARRLAAMKTRWAGTVVFIVQPAEEALGGAKSMLADGLYSRFPKPNYALAFHVTSSLPTGKVSASEETFACEPILLTIDDANSWFSMRCRGCMFDVVRWRWRCGAGGPGLARRCAARPNVVCDQG